MKEALTKNLSIKSWAEHDRPREKLSQQGRNTLSDAELLAILIGSGTRKQTAVDLAKYILNKAGNNLHQLGKFGVEDLKKFPGIGEAKAITIVAALELGIRRKAQQPLKRKRITSSQQAYEVIYPELVDQQVEQFWVILLNKGNLLLDKVLVSKGGRASTTADPAVIYKNAVDRLATGIILCHNHPSGNLQPSEADKQLTAKLKRAGELFDIQVMDHIIVAGDSYFSFTDTGEMGKL